MKGRTEEESNNILIQSLKENAKNKTLKKAQITGVELAAMARSIGTLKPPQTQHSGTVVLISLVFRACFYLHQFLFLTLVLTPTNFNY